MIIRVGFVLVALISAAITVAQNNLSRSRKRNSSTDTKHGNLGFCRGEIGKENSKLDASHVERREKDEKIENSRSESILEQLSNGPEKSDYEMDEFPVQESKWDSVREINRLKKIVKEKEQRTENLELELIELYCLKGQQSSIAVLEKQLKDKTEEMDVLTAKVNELQTERKRLYEELKQNHLAEKELESSKQTILELQVKMEVDAGGLKEHLTVMRERVLAFDVDRESRKLNKFDKKLKVMKEAELEALKMKRRQRELQLEKREMTVKLDAAEARIASLSCMTEQTVVARIEEQINGLKGANNCLTEQVEKLHKNRFSILEELVYQRWLNSCLRFEFQDYCSPQPRRIQAEISKKLSFQSEDESKLSSLDPGSEISSAESDEITNTTINSSSSSPSVKSKKSSLSFNINRWRSSSKNGNANVENNSLRRKPGLFRRVSMSSVPSITSGQRNQVVKNDIQGSASLIIPATQRVRRVSFNDALNSVAYTYDHIPRSVQRAQNDDQIVPEIINDWSDMETSTSLDPTSQKESFDMALLRVEFTKPKASADLNQEDSDSNKINNHVELKNEIVAAECPNSGMSNVAPPKTSNFSKHMMNLIVTFIFIFFLFLAYITLLISRRVTSSLGPQQNLTL